MAVFWLLAGLLLLILGAEILVRGASRLAASFGVSALVVGSTVVAFGTSAPELAVGVESALAGQSNLTVGAVVGSNTFNVLFILGISAVVAPLAVGPRVLRFDVPAMIGASSLAAAFAFDGQIGRTEGAVLTACLVAYSVGLFWLERGGAIASPDQPTGSPSSRWLLTTQVVAGLGLLVVGSQWLVDGAVSVASWWGVSDLVIGLTIVSAGTSLPELVTSIIASLRGEREIAVGNVIGSNLFNLLGVLGLSACLAPGGIAVNASVLRYDLPVMVAVAAACWPVFYTGMAIARWEGALFLAMYAAYVAYLVLEATRHAAAFALADTMCWFVLPFCVALLTTTSVRAWRSGRRRPE